MNLARAVQSSIGRKIINGITGLFFVGFVIGHLTGNFLLFAGPEAFNNYAYFLTHLFHGVGLIIIEIVMLAFLGMHAFSGISVWMNKWEARKKGYEMSRGAGGKSRKSFASSSMLWSGILLLVFIAVHVAQFKFGLMDGRNEAGQSVLIDGVLVRNVYGLVIATFSDARWWLVYSVVLGALGLHLWHGAWSAFQSLGLANDNYLPTIRKAANALAVLLTVGFLLIPTVIYLDSLRTDEKTFQKWDHEYVQAHSAPMHIPPTPSH